MFENIVLPVLAAVAAGLGWSTVGIWSKWRSGGEAEIDYGKLKKNIIVGAVVGFVSWGYLIAQGNMSPIITDVASLIAAIMIYFPIIVIVDKLLVKADESKEDLDDEIDRLEEEEYDDDYEE